MAFPTHTPGIKAMPASRRFGNENQQHAPRPEDWLTLTRAAAAAAPPAPVMPSFPYPQKYIINFAVAQTVELFIPVTGYAVSFWDSTNASDLVNVRFALGQGDVAGAQVPFRPGHALGLGDFTWLGLTWAAIAGATGTLLIVPRGVLLDENH